MSRSIEDIRAALTALSERWATYSGTERAASQTFLNQLVSAYTGEPDAMAAGARFEEFGVRDEGSGFMDLYWQDVTIIEMKAPNQSRRLDQHRAQALDYWSNSANQEAGIKAPPHLVLCSIQQFEVWQPGQYPHNPVDVFSLADLPDRVESR
ncbi:MAG: type IIL restriction-modification enzyme MmeI, partial [Actinomycetota bacterium]